MSLVLGLAAIVVPATGRELRFARKAIALAQAETIARAVRAFLDDARLKPAHGGYGALLGSGTAPSPAAAVDGATLALLNAQEPPPAIASSIRGAWRGGYEVPVDPDPYGRAFVVTSFGDPGSIVWCVSAGKNGCVETTAADVQPQGDDVGVRVR
ncbi:MAG TPA: hypothetical protein VKE69_01535 [Planctomycetota bacterium]|nr:hypothetical protein [Planctomycetota bacterium]